MLVSSCQHPTPWPRGFYSSASRPSRLSVARVRIPQWPGLLLQPPFSGLGSTATPPDPIAGLSLLFKRPLQPHPTPDVPSRRIFHRPDMYVSRADCLSLLEPKIFLGFRKVQISAHVLRAWCLTLVPKGAPGTDSHIVSLIFLVGLQSFTFLQRQT